MAVHQLPVETGVFARYLKGLTAQLDRNGGWYGVFLQRDPEGMRDCLDGVEVPPWDVVEALLHDLTAARGSGFAERERFRARGLHAAAVSAYDRRPGGRENLADSLELMRGELIHAAARADGLARRLASEPEGTQAAEDLAYELTWTRDDHARAAARITELRSRLASLAAVPEQGRKRRGRAVPASGPRSAPTRPGRAAASDASGPPPVAAPTHERDDSGAGTGDSAHRARPVSRPADPEEQPPKPPRGPHPPNTPAPRSGRIAGSYNRRVPGPYDRDPTPHPAGHAPGPAPDETPAPSARRPAAEPPAPAPDPATDPSASARKPKRRRLLGARYAGIEDTAADAPDVSAPPPVAGDAPRGARYRGAGILASRPAAAGAGPRADDEAAVQAARGTVETLVRLRAENRGGEAHVVLCQAAALPAPWLPVLADELDRAELGADWTTLLWDAASQPVPRLMDIVGALSTAGRTHDSAQLLRHGVTRPADEFAVALLALEDAGRGDEAKSLLTVYARQHSAEDCTRIAGHDPALFVPRLLDAARAHSRSHERDLRHALRGAGHLAD